MSETLHPAHRRSPSESRAPRQPNNQFLPTLFDRLCDDAPSQTKEAPQAYVADRQQLRQIILRDLINLLNTTNIQNLLQEKRHPHVASSTINYGVPPLAGSYMASRRWFDIEKIIRQAIIDFEPRLLPESVTVKPLLQKEGKHTYNILRFEISGTVQIQPYPMEFTVQSAVDLETSRLTVVDA